MLGRDILDKIILGGRLCGVKAGACLDGSAQRGLPGRSTLGD